MHEVHFFLLPLFAAGSPAPNLSVSPSSSAIPGGSAIQTILSGLLWFAFAISVLGILLSSLAMGIGKHSSNGRLHERGREGLLAAIVAAVVSGGAASIVTWAFSLGSSIH